MDDYDTDIEPDPDADGLIEAMAHLRSAEIALRPVLIRAEEKRRVRLAVRRTRAQKGDSSRQRRIA